MAEPEITAEQLIDWTSVRIRRDFAEGVARYANLRASGLLPVDARREADVSQQTGNKYENWMQGYRRDHGLPELPIGSAPDLSFRGMSKDRMRSGSTSGAHSRWHKARGITKPGCAECEADDE